MNKIKFLARALVLMTVMAPSTHVYAAASQAESNAAEKNVDIDKSVNLQNSINLTDEIAKENQDSNVMFSPTSLNFALGMIAEGAKGETKNALNEYLGTDDFAAYARKYMNAIKSCNTEDENYGYTSKLKIADALWVNQGLALQDQFQKSAEDNFEAKAEILNFSDKENTCNTINAWCNENTDGLIPEIMKPDMLNENSELCLTNSLYFESGWSQDPWDVSDQKEKFGDNEETKYMTNTGDNYYENGAATAFEKFYANNLSFIGILPKAEGDFTLDALDIEDLLKSEPEYDEVNCKMPKLNFEATAELSDILSKIGLENIFSDDADFSGIADKAVHVSSVLQKTKLELDENGTKAAAVTAVTMECMSAMAPDPIVKDVELTRPFAFLIYDNMNEEVLFMGKVLKVN
nr:serpin family protein [uncultured Blautia sp.]